MMKLVPLLLLAVFFSTSCSRVRTIERIGNMLAWRELDDVFEFHGEKKEEVRKEYDQLATDFKAKNFPVWASELDRISELVQNSKLTEADYKKSTESVRDSFFAFSPRFTVSADKLIDLMGDREFDNLVENYSEKIKKAQKKGPEEQNEKIEDRVRDGLKFFIGRLNADQKKKIEKFFEKEKFPYTSQIEYRQHNLDLVKKTKGDKAQLKQLLREALKERTPEQLTGFLAERRQFADKVNVMIYQVISSLDESQKQNFIKNLKTIADDLRGAAS